MSATRKAPACSRRDAVGRLTALGLAGFTLTPAAAQPMLPAPASLPDALASALAAAQPLVVMVSLAGCPYCKIVRENYLLHEHAAGLPVVQVDFRDKRPVRDFDGAVRTHDELIRRWRVDVAPTVLFFGRGGREVAGRLNGNASSDFYGAYLEQALQQARKAVRG